MWYNENMYRYAARIALLLSVMPTVVFAQSGTSSQYNGYNLGTTPATVQASSPNYILNGSLEPIVGETPTSTNYQGGAGAPKPFTPTSTITPVGGPTGGIPTYPSDPLGLWTQPGSALVVKPTILHRPWTYLSTGKVFGSRGTAGATILLNQSSQGIEYPSSIAWEKARHPLFLGNNTLVAQAQVSGAYSYPVQSVMRRRLQGDYNDSQYVDDIDLSLFSRAWEHNADIYADFNEDGVVDDVDLSLLVSHWNHYF